MPRQKKRAIEVVDSTQGESSRAAKSPRFPSSVNAPGSSQSSIAYSHLPSSSAPVPSSSAGGQGSSWQNPVNLEDGDDVEPSTQALTQSDEPSSRFELYGAFDGKIVGVRYYSGMATAGEVVVCRREPSNQVNDLVPALFSRITLTRQVRFKRNSDRQCLRTPDWTHSKDSGSEARSISCTFTSRAGIISECSHLPGQRRHCHRSRPYWGERLLRLSHPHFHIWDQRCTCPGRFGGAA